MRREMMQMRNVARAFLHRNEIGAFEQRRQHFVADCRARARREVVQHDGHVEAVVDLQQMGQQFFLSRLCVVRRSEQQRVQAGPLRFMTEADHFFRSGRVDARGQIRLAACGFGDGVEGLHAFIETQRVVFARGPANAKTRDAARQIRGVLAEQCVIYLAVGLERCDERCVDSSKLMSVLS